MLNSIPKCKCDNDVKFINSTELQPGHNEQTYICIKCNEVYVYDMIYPINIF